MNDQTIITITAAAIAHIKTILQKRSDSIGFRLTMKKYGCNGFGYVPDVVNSKHPQDIEFTVDGLKIFVDTDYQDMLTGTEVDYVEKALGLKQLVFRNPNVDGECGCGESVNFKGAE